MTEMEPQLTIIIPTLNRCETLYWAIKTVVEQTYQNLKIIVSDNCSDDDTFKVVQQFSDSRLFYVKTPQRFTMLGHFEFALNYVTDGYVSFIGDDDGFLPGSLEKVAHVLKKHSPEAVGWRFGNYNWPGLPGFFYIPMANYYRKVNAEKEIAEVFKESFYQSIRFPSLYGGFISVKFVLGLKSKYNGTFFHSRIPDFFSGSLIAASVKEYIRLEFPITINATSKSSAGYATVSTTVDQKPFEGLRKDEGNVPFHPSLVFIRCNVVPIADALLQVNKLIPAFPKVDMKKVLDEIAKELIVESDDRKFVELREGIFEIAKKNNLEDYAGHILSSIERKPVPHLVKRKFSPISNSLYIDAEKAGINNVYEAASFANGMISKQFFQVPFPAYKWVCVATQMVRYAWFKLFSHYRKCI